VGAVGQSVGCVGGNAAGFQTPQVQAQLPCGIGFSLPTIKFSFNVELLLEQLVPGFFALLLPKLLLQLTISCDLSKPVDVTGGVALPFGGGRIPACDGDTDVLQAAA
jgi:hypothetical protein